MLSKRQPACCFWPRAKETDHLLLIMACVRLKMARAMDSCGMALCNVRLMIRSSKELWLALLAVA